uniref:CCHC-type domain-containing protein n=1 Tax=Tanacetum cinerariifolium TaxID=118510 RepID=A0A6L2JV78_TANCI|nr:hypothetical protein [Tanacetum cinerariifolium]
MHTARDDSLLGTIRFASRHEDTQVYDAILPNAMTNQSMLDFVAYKTYYAIASGAEPPNSKKSQKKSDLAISSEESPSKKKPAKSKKDATSTKKPATKPKSSKNKAPIKADRGKCLNVLSEASGSGNGTNFESRVPDEQQRKTSGTDEGTDVDDEDDSKDVSDDDMGNDDDDDGGNDDDDGHDHDRDDERTESDRDEILDPNQTNEEQTKQEDEDIDERVHTPTDYKLTDEEKMDEKEEDDVTKELYKDINKNEGPMQSSSVSSEFTRVEMRKIKIKNPPLDQTEGQKERSLARNLGHKKIYGQRKGSHQAYLKNRKDLPRDTLQVSVEVLRYGIKRSKSENNGILSTEMELVLEQTQQGTSHEISGPAGRPFRCVSDILELRLEEHWDMLVLVTSGDARSWHMISGDAKSWVYIAVNDDDSKCWPACCHITRRGMGGRAGSVGGRTRDHSGDQGDDMIDGQGCQVGGQGSEINDCVNGVPDFSTIIVQQLQNLLLTIVAQVGDQGRGQGNGRHQNGNAVNNSIQGDVSRGCTYKEFLACNPKEYDGKRIERYVYGLASRIQGMVAEMEPKTIQKVVQIAGTLTDKALRNGSIKKNPEKRGNRGEPSKDRNVRDENKRTRTRNAFATTTNPVGRENTGAVPKCTIYSTYHPPGARCRTCFNYNRPGHFAKACRVAPRNVNPINARNPVARACYECGSINHIKSAYPGLNRAQRPGVNHHNQVVAVNESQGRGNLRNRARCRAFMSRAEEAHRTRTL